MIVTLLDPRDSGRLSTQDRCCQWNATFALLVASVLIRTAYRAEGPIPRTRTRTRSTPVGDIFETPIHTLQGDEGSLSPYKGKALLMVNVASDVA